MTIAASVCALIIEIPLIAGVFIDGGIKEKIARRYFAMLACCLLGTCCELIAALLAGTPGVMATRIIRAADMLNYVFASGVFIACSDYFYRYMSMTTTVDRRPFVLATGLSIVNTLLILYVQYREVFAHLDEHNYLHIESGIWVTQVLWILGMLVLCAGVLRYAKRFERRVPMSVVCYVCLLILCYGVEYLLPGIWISYLGCAVALLIVYINIQIDVNHKLKMRRHELADNHVAVMLSQIQPDFLYDTLSSIESLCDEEDSKQAAAAIRDFSKYLRGNMDSLTFRTPIPFWRELDHVKLYLSLEQKRGDGRIRSVFDIRATGFLLPALTVQPIVENALKHGIAPRGGDGTIRIASFEEETRWCVEVEDDGVGFEALPPSSAESGNVHSGIAYVKERLERMCRGTLDIASAPGKGTTVTIAIPKQ